MNVRSFFRAVGAIIGQNVAVDISSASYKETFFSEAAKYVGINYSVGDWKHQGRLETIIRNVRHFSGLAISDADMAALVRNIDGGQGFAVTDLKVGDQLRNATVTLSLNVNAIRALMKRIYDSVPYGQWQDYSFVAQDGFIGRVSIYIEIDKQSQDMANNGGYSSVFINNVSIFGVHVNDDGTLKPGSNVQNTSTTFGNTSMVVSQIITSGNLTGTAALVELLGGIQLQFGQRKVVRLHEIPVGADLGDCVVTIDRDALTDAVLVDIANGIKASGPGALIVASTLQHLISITSSQIDNAAWMFNMRGGSLNAENENIMSINGLHGPTIIVNTPWSATLTPVYVMTNGFKESGHTDAWIDLLVPHIAIAYWGD